jgi:hypothetical protein
MKMRKGMSAVAAGMILAFACTVFSNADTKADTKQAAPSEDVTEISEAASTTVETETEESTDDEPLAESGILVVYFSRTGEQYTVGEIEKGNTAIVAEMIGEEAGADLFEILPADDHYPMTYDELTDVAKQEQNEKARPE